MIKKIRIQYLIAKIIPKIKCFFLGHRYSYQIGNWWKGRYEDIYLTCDRCNRNFLKITQTEISPKDV